MTTAKPSENDESLPPKLLDLSLSSLTSASTSASTGLATVDDALTKQSNNDDKELEVEVQVEEALLRARLERQLRWLAVVRCLRAAHLAQPLLVPYYSQSLGLPPTGVLWLGSLYSACESR